MCLVDEDLVQWDVILHKFHLGHRAASLRALRMLSGGSCLQRESRSKDRNSLLNPLQVPTDDPIKRITSH